MYMIEPSILDGSRTKVITRDTSDRAREAHACRVTASAPPLRAQSDTRNVTCLTMLHLPGTISPSFAMPTLRLLRLLSVVVSVQPRSFFFCACFSAGCRLKQHRFPRSH